MRLRQKLVSITAGLVLLSMFQSVPASAAGTATLKVKQIGSVAEVTWVYKNAKPTSQTLTVTEKPTTPTEPPLVVDPPVDPIATPESEAKVYELKSALRSKKLSGLKVGTSYEITIASKKPSLTTTRTFTLLAAPTAATALQLVWIDSSLMVTWTYAGPTATDYNITYTGSGKKPVTVRTGSSAEVFEIKKLSKNLGYTVQVQAVNGAGSGPKAKETILRAAPAQVTDILVSPTSATGDAVTLSWKYKGPSLTRTQVQIRGAGFARNLDTISLSSSTRSTEITGLSDGGTYTFAVYTQNLEGKTSKVSTAYNVVKPLGAPTNLSAKSGTGSVVLKWLQPSADVANPITGYRIDTSADNGVSWSPDIKTGPETTFTVFNLTNAKSYTFRVAAITATGPGLTSEVVAAVAGLAPTQPESVKVASGVKEATVSWSEPTTTSGAILGYAVEYKVSTSLTWTKLPVVTELITTVKELVGGTKYDFRVTAQGESGPSAPSTIVSATAYDVPAAPTLTVTAGNRKVDLKWTTPLGRGASVTGFTIEQQTADGQWTPVTPSPISGLTYTVQNLTPGLQYAFRVSANNIAGIGDNSNVSTLTLTASPDAPVITGVAGAGVATISWEAPLSFGAAITSYKIERSVAGGSWTTLSESITGLSYSATGLTNGTRYNFRVSAKNSVGWSAQSASIEVIPVTTPSAVTGVTVEPLIQEVNVRWTALGATGASTGGSKIIGYQVYYRQIGGAWVAADGQALDTATSFEVSNLTAGVTYEFKVVAVNAIGFGPDGAMARAIPANSPQAVTGLSANATDAAVQLIWGAPIQPITPQLGGTYKYRVEYSADNVNWFLGNNNQGTSAGVTNLSNGVPYTFRVSAGYTISGQTYYGEVATIVATPRGLPGAPQNLTITQLSATSTQLNWAAPISNGGGVIEGYEVSYTSNGSTWLPVVTLVANITKKAVSSNIVTLTTSAEHGFIVGDRVVVAGIDTTLNGTYTITTRTPNTFSYAKTTPDVSEVAITTGTPTANVVTGIFVTDTTSTITGLTPGLPYTFRVRVRNSYGVGTLYASSELTQVALPGSISGLTTRQSADSQITVTWNASPAAQKVSGYRIEVSTNGSTWQLVQASLANTVYTVTGLTNGLTYTIRVSAVNGAGTGTPSTTTGTPVGPLPVTGVSATADDKQVTLRWTAPAAGGATQNGVRVRYSVDGGANWTVAAASLAASTTSYVVTGLTNGTATTFEIVSITSVGNSPAAVVTSTPISTLPGAVTALAASTTSTTSVLTWTAPAAAGYGALSYKVEFKTTAAVNWSTASSSVSATTFTVTGLTASTEYQFRLTATNAIGAGPVEAVTATTAATAG